MMLKCRSRRCIPCFHSHVHYQYELYCLFMVHALTAQPSLLFL